MSADHNQSSAVCNHTAVGTCDCAGNSNAGGRTSGLCACSGGNVAGRAPRLRGARFPRLVVATIMLALVPLCHAMAGLLLRDAVPLCPFRCATGWPCPLCGLTRAIALASHGQWGPATAMNPLWPVFVTLALTFAILLFIDAWRRSDRAGYLLRALSGAWRWWAPGLLAFGIWRIMTA